MTLLIKVCFTRLIEGCERERELPCESKGGRQVKVEGDGTISEIEGYIFNYTFYNQRRCPFNSTPAFPPLAGLLAPWLDASYIEHRGEVPIRLMMQLFAIMSNCRLAS